jgi:hypothetical protein
MPSVPKKVTERLISGLNRKYAEKESNLERKLEILKLADWLELPSGKIRFSKKKSEKVQP